MTEALQWAAVVLGLCSAAAWLRSSVVKVTEEQATARLGRAKAQGKRYTGGYVFLDGWDMSATFAAQSRWNAIGAVFAACSIGLQALSQLLRTI